MTILNYWQIFKQEHFPSILPDNFVQLDFKHSLSSQTSKQSEFNRQVMPVDPAEFRFI